MFRSQQWTLSDRFLRVLSGALISLMGSPALAADGKPSVVTSVPAIHSLVLQVVDGTQADAALFLEPGDSVHDVNLTARKLEMLAGADLVVILGADEPDVLDHDELDQLRGDRGGVVRLVEDLPYELLVFSEHCHNHDRDGHLDEHDDDHDSHDDDDDHHEHDDDHDSHDDDDDHHEHDDDHESHDDHDDHHDDNSHDDSHDEDHEHDDHDDHDRNGDEMSRSEPGCVDPHMWLSLDAASGIVDVVSTALSESDPANAGSYSANAKRAVQGLRELDAQLSSILGNSTVRQVVVWHDSYRYFALRDDVRPYYDAEQQDVHFSTVSGRRLVEIRERLAEDGPGCLIFGAPEVEESHGDSFTDIADTGTISVIPFGEISAVNKGSYAELMTSVAKGFASCGR